MVFFFLLQAAWVLKHFCELKFKNEQNLKTSLEMVRQCLCSDKELPVRVEAAVALQVLLVEQEKGKRQGKCRYSIMFVVLLILVVMHTDAIFVVSM